MHTNELLIDKLQASAQNYTGHIAREILARKQIADIRAALGVERIPFLLLKGISLIADVYPAIGSRFFEDIDLLIRASDMGRIDHVLSGLGYTPHPDDPLGWLPREAGLPIDLHIDLWYMTRRELAQVFLTPRYVTIDGLRYATVSREDMLLHIVAHGLIHHGARSGHWHEDVRRMCARWQSALDCERVLQSARGYGLLPALRVACEELPELGALLPKGRAWPRKTTHDYLLPWLLRRTHPQKGHLMRLLFQRTVAASIRYLLRWLFPPPWFMRRRYHVHTAFTLCVSYFYRPIHSFWNARKLR